MREAQSGPAEFYAVSRSLRRCFNLRSTPPPCSQSQKEFGPAILAERPPKSDTKTFSQPAISYHGNLKCPEQPLKFLGPAPGDGPNTPGGRCVNFQLSVLTRTLPRYMIVPCDSPAVARFIPAGSRTKRVGVADGGLNMDSIRNAQILEVRLAKVDQSCRWKHSRQLLITRPLLAVLIVGIHALHSVAHEDSASIIMGRNTSLILTPSQ